MLDRIEHVHTMSGMKTKKAPAAKNAGLNTHIAIVLDRSGSMSSIRNEIIGGFNAFLKDQQAVKGTATLTLVQFDNEIDRLASFAAIDGVSPLNDKTYVPRGMTKLYDAIGLTVTSTQDDIGKAKTKPDKVLVVILTDGMENSSQEYDATKIKTLLEDRQRDGWEFSFIGANQDAVLTARGIGLANAASNITFSATKDGAQNIMRSLSHATTSFRCSASAPMAYSTQDREAQTGTPGSSFEEAKKAVFSEHGHHAGSIGGPARSASLTPKRRSDIARTAAQARWSRESV